MGSRNGQTPVILWYALQTRGYDGLAREAKICIHNAQYLFQQLKIREYPCMLNNFSNTVVFQKPSQKLIKKWQLAIFENWAHIIVIQNIEREKIDTFINELLLHQGLVNNAEDFQLQPLVH